MAEVHEGETEQNNSQLEKQLIKHYTEIGTALAEGRLSIEEFAKQQARSDLEKNRKTETAIERSIKDPLTGLYSRTLLMEDVEQRLEEARRGKPVSYLMIDLDEYKQVNDQYGHQAGDEVLIELGKRLSKTLRLYDRVYRYGGDEMGALIDATGPHAVGISERLRSKVFGSPIKITVEGEEKQIHVSASIGVGSFDPQGEVVSSSELIRRADELSYYGKRAGKNCTAFVANSETVGIIQNDPNNPSTAAIKYVPRVGPAK